MDTLPPEGNEEKELRNTAGFTLSRNTQTISLHHEIEDLLKFILNTPNELNRKILENWNKIHVMEASLKIHSVDSRPCPQESKSKLSPDLGGEQEMAEAWCSHIGLMDQYHGPLSNSSLRPCTTAECLKGMSYIQLFSGCLKEMQNTQLVPWMSHLPTFHMVSLLEIYMKR